MAKKKENFLLVVLVIVGVVMFMGQGGDAPAPNGGGSTGGNTGGVNLCQLVDGQVSFTAQDQFLAGTARTTDWVRVIEMNGGDKVRDIGQVSTNSGTKGVSPEGAYKLYYGENTTATARYTYVEDYSAPCKDATDYKVGYLCTVDTTPSVTVFDENGQVQSGTTNAQAVGASEIIDVEVKIKAAADQCYGNPQAAEKGLKNAICFSYNGSEFDSVKANTPATAIPYSVSADVNKPTGYSQNCYEFDLLADTQSQTLTVTLDASATQPAGVGDAINITLEDVAFDLNQDTLQEIWGFQDESNNNLGAGIRRVASIQVT